MLQNKTGLLINHYDYRVSWELSVQY